MKRVGDEMPYTLNDSKSSLSNSVHVLGIFWNFEEDVLVLDFSFITEVADNETKRSTLKTLLKLFDAAGFVSPVILYGKIFFQDLCKIGLGWDDVIPVEMSPRWKLWINDLRQHKQFRIPRCYFQKLG